MGGGAATMTHELVEHGGDNGERGRLGSAWRRKQRARDGMGAAAAHRPVPLLWHGVAGPTAVYRHHAEGARYMQSAMTYADLNQLT